MFRNFFIIFRAVVEPLCSLFPSNTHSERAGQIKRRIGWGWGWAGVAAAAAVVFVCCFCLSCQGRFARHVAEEGADTYHDHIQTAHGRTRPQKTRPDRTKPYKTAADRTRPHQTAAEGPGPASRPPTLGAPAQQIRDAPHGELEQSPDRVGAVRCRFSRTTKTHTHIHTWKLTK